MLISSEIIIFYTPDSWGNFWACSGYEAAMIYEKEMQEDGFDDKMIKAYDVWVYNNHIIFSEVPFFGGSYKTRPLIYNIFEYTKDDIRPKFLFTVYEQENQKIDDLLLAELKEYFY